MWSVDCGPVELKVRRTRNLRCSAAGRLAVAVGPWRPTIALVSTVSEIFEFTSRPPATAASSAFATTARPMSALAAAPQSIQSDSRAAAAT